MINESDLVCILFVFTTRIDDMLQRWLDIFKASGLDSNVILVKNKILNDYTCDVGDFGGFKVINI